MTGQSLPVSGVILAGGRGLRMGGKDKGLIPYGGMTLVESVIGMLAPQVSDLVINANRNIDAYARFGYPVHADVVDGYHGPLVGMLTGLSLASHEYTVFAPCDAVALPEDLVARFRSAMQASGSLACYAHDGARAHPVHALLHRSCLGSLLDYLEAGERSVMPWMQQVGARQVDFSDCRQDFRNINQPADLDCSTR
ncbi:MAG: molybdenum cofactor guanylyltransferase MobA [Gammaproteobacteria bacterium]